MMEWGCSECGKVVTTMRGVAQVTHTCRKKGGDTTRMLPVGLARPKKPKATKPAIPASVRAAQRRIVKHWGSA